MVDAEDKEKSEKKAQKTEPTPKTFPKKWVFAGVLVLFLVGGSYAVWSFFLAGRFSQKHDQEIANLEEPSPGSNTSAAIIHDLAPFIVNLLDNDGKRYLRTKIELEVENNNIKRELEQRTPQLRDSILLLLTSKSFEDISSPEGKIQLRNELILRINKVLQRGAIQALYFTEFVVQ